MYGEDDSRCDRCLSQSSLFRIGALVMVWLGVGAAPLAAQTDFYNLDKDRPLRVEDAYATKRYAFEVQVSPFTLAQHRDGAIRYTPAVELKHGLWPGLEVSAGANAVAHRSDTGTELRAGDLELSGLLNLTVETARLPAAGVRVTGHVPVGSGDHGSSLEVKGILTRSLVGPVRAHVNGAWLLGGGVAERWWAGLALDYALPFQHTLLLSEVYVSGLEGGSRRIHTTTGLRYQVSPALAFDGGVGRTWTGPDGEDWHLTIGFTHEFGIRALIPGGRR